MRLEEISERAMWAEMNAPSGSDVEKVLESLLRDVDAAIAERALPVTREWLESGESGLVKRKTSLGAVYFSSAGTLIAYHPAKNQWFLNGGSVDLKITTRGQLLDLLSGLGVRK